MSMRALSVAIVAVFLDHVGNMKRSPGHEDGGAKRKVADC